MWMRSCFAFTSVRLPGCSPAEPESRGSLSPQLSPQPLCGNGPHGQWAILDADMSQLIDRSSCLVEPCVSDGVFAPPVLVLSPQQARPTPRPVVAHEYPSRGLFRRSCRSSELLFRAALSLPSLHCDCFRHLPLSRRPCRESACALLLLTWPSAS